jgi:hypothetical protein
MIPKNTLRIFRACTRNKALTWPLGIEEGIMFVSMFEKYSANTQTEYSWLSTGSSGVLF